MLHDNLLRFLLCRVVSSVFVLRAEETQKCFYAATAEANGSNVILLLR